MRFHVFGFPTILMAALPSVSGWLMHLTKVLISSSVYGIPLSFTGTPYSSMQHSNGKLLSPNLLSPTSNGRSIPSFFSATFRSCRLPHKTKSFSFSSESLDERAERLRDRQIVMLRCKSCTYSQGSILSRHWARAVSIVKGKRIGVLPLGASASSTRRKKCHLNLPERSELFNNCDPPFEEVETDAWLVSGVFVHLQKFSSSLGQ